MLLGGEENTFTKSILECVAIGLLHLVASNMKNLYNKVL